MSRLIDALCVRSEMQMFNPWFANWDKLVLGLRMKCNTMRESKWVPVRQEVNSNADGICFGKWCAATFH